MNLKQSIMDTEQKAEAWDYMYKSLQIIRDGIILSDDARSLARDSLLAMEASEEYILSNK